MQINNVIVDSIPIRKDCKKYFLSKYRHLCKHNGPEAAMKVFKDLSSYLKATRSGASRPCPIRRTGWVKYLEQSMLTQPHNVLNFLKFYTVQGKIDIDATSREYHEAVSRVTANADVPKPLMAWLSFITEPLSETKRLYGRRKSTKTYEMYSYFRSHTLKDVLSYKAKWRRVLRGDGKLNTKSWYEPVTPMMYKDVVHLTDVSQQELDNQHIYHSETFMKDLEALPYYLDNALELSQRTREFVYSTQAEYFRLASLEGILSVDDPSYYKHTDVLGTAFAGQIHYIPKHGSDYRAIAVPNRFIQSALRPGYDFLTTISRLLPKDCTYNQDRFDERIRNRVSNDSLYTFGIDLSKATDNLPLAWFSAIMDAIVTLHPSPLNPDISASLELFEQVSRSAFENEGFPTRWTVGQPLGTLPSFQVLAITHNILCEALALSSGQGHSPYAVLGDDLVVFNKKLKRAYISTLEQHSIPISLQKSYGGKLVEFAGKTFVRNALPFFTPSHSVITYESLFDYQRATGIAIPWPSLPRKIRKRWLKTIASVMSDVRAKHGIPGEKVYYNAQRAIMVDRGTKANMYKHEPEFYEALGFALAETQGDALVGRLIPSLTSNAHVIRGKVVTVVSQRHSFNYTFQQKPLPAWYKQKFRPVPTDLLAAQGYIIYEQLAYPNITP